MSGGEGARYEPCEELSGYEGKGRGEVKGGRRLVKEGKREEREEREENKLYQIQKRRR